MGLIAVFAVFAPVLIAVFFIVLMARKRNATLEGKKP